MAPPATQFFKKNFTEVIQIRRNIVSMENIKLFICFYCFITLFKFHVYHMIIWLIHTLRHAHHQKSSFNLLPYNWLWHLIVFFFPLFYGQNPMITLSYHLDLFGEGCFYSWDWTHPLPVPSITWDVTSTVCTLVREQGVGLQYSFNLPKNCARYLSWKLRIYGLADLHYIQIMINWE